MTRLIDSVVKLTDTRDRNALAFSLSRVIFDLTQPQRLSMWSVVAGDTNTPEIDEVLCLPAQCNWNGKRSDTAANRISLASDGLLHSCFRKRGSQNQRLAKESEYRFVAPLMRGTEVVAILDLTYPCPPREYSLRLITGVLQIYSNYVGLLDENDHDALTGLLNRKVFTEFFQRRARLDSVEPRLPPQLDQRTSTEKPETLGLAVIDIDFFKRINDTFGHPYGDEVLILLSQLLRNNVRDCDLIFRIGGEEFVIIIAQCDLPIAQMVLERLRAVIERHSFPQVGRVTVSTGFTMVLPFDNGSEAFGRADKALYYAKQNGRNQVRQYEQLIDSSLLHVDSPEEGEIEIF